jgi:hypothetical protein
MIRFARFRCTACCCSDYHCSFFQFPLAKKRAPDDTGALNWTRQNSGGWEDVHLPDACRLGYKGPALARSSSNTKSIVLQAASASAKVLNEDLDRARP